MDALLASHYSVDVIPDWKLVEVAREYPLIVVPDWLDLGAEAHDAVRSYVEAGGSALVCGAANGTLFAAELGVKPGVPAQSQAAWIPGAEQFANVRGLWLDVDPASAEVIETAARRFGFDGGRRNRRRRWAPLGAGKIAGFYGPLGAVFAAKNAPAVRQLVDRLAKRLFTPMVSVTAPPVIEVALRRKAGKLLVHVANLAGMPDSEERSVTDYIPPVGPVELSLRVPRPSTVTWEPGGKKLDAKWESGELRVRLERVEVHGMVAIS